MIVHNKGIWITVAGSFGGTVEPVYNREVTCQQRLKCTLLGLSRLTVVRRPAHTVTVIDNFDIEPIFENGAISCETELRWP